MNVYCRDIYFFVQCIRVISLGLRLKIVKKFGMVLNKLSVLSLQLVIEPLKLLHVITDRHMIADMFNIFFANIGKDLACSIPNVDMSPLEYLKTPLCNSFFISPTTAEEIESEITKVKSSKATGPFSIPVTILKILENCCIQASTGFVQCLL